MEIELKFLIEKEQLDPFFHLINNTPFQVKPVPTLDLYNAYFDTQDNTLRQWDFGLRTRSSIDNSGHGWSEQTVKLAGQDIGGLHQRPEHTVKFAHQDKVFADLTLFSADIWPQGFEAPAVQVRLLKIFETQFKRRIWHIITPSGSEIECVLDTGSVIANNTSTDICEIELELQSGSVSDVFLIGQYFSQHLPLKLGSLSKAARGYMLANDSSLSCSNLEVMRFNHNTSIESSFITALSSAIKFIQHNEMVFSQTDSAKALRRVIDGVSLLIRVLKLYAKLLPGSQCEYFVQAFKSFRKQNEWVNLFYQFEQLASRKSPYRKDIKKSDYLLKLLSDQQLPEAKIAKAKRQFSSSEFNALMLKLLLWINQKSWRTEMELADLRILSQPLGTQSGPWLDQAWHKLKSAIEQFVQYKGQENIEIEQIAIEKVYVPLTTELLTGLCLGNLYRQDEWQVFRGNLLDFLVGLEELMLLKALGSLLAGQENDEVAVQQKWLESKQTSLLTALKVSASHVAKLKPYW